MIFINGRFLSQPISGVQRFARELVAALDASLAARSDLQPWVVIIPPGVTCDLKLRHIKIRTAGQLSGHAWEQIDLYLASRSGLLINLCNSGPVLHGRSLTVIHDAMVFRTPENFSRAYRAFHRVLGRLLALRSHLGTVSNFSRGELAHFLKAKSVFVVPNSAEHMAGITPSSDVLERLGLDAGRFAMFVGSPTPNKNLQTAITAIERLGGAAPKFVIVGATNQSVFGTAVSTANDNVLFAGRLSDSDIVGLYKNAGALIFPSLYEGFGIPPLEAMMHGCPVVASDIPPVKEVCGNAALYVDATDPDAIAVALSQILCDFDLRSNLAARGLERARLFSWSASADIVRGVVATL